MLTREDEVEIVALHRVGWSISAIATPAATARPSAPGCAGARAQTAGAPLRRGWLVDNPVAKLEPGEKPHWTPQPVRWTW